MLDMSTWVVKHLSVMHDLKLDPKNVRLGVAFHSDPPQADIIQDLFQHEGALDIAKSIMSVGYLSHERPIVLKQDDHWVVVEGNRRTAALKALLNPYLVPAMQPRLAELVEATPVPENYKTIECLVAPDRDSANQLIATLHTSNPRKPWGPLRQAEFFAAQLEAGKSVETLIAEYPGIKVADFITTAEMHKLLKTASYQDEDLARYVNRRNFPISTFERLYENPDFLTMARLSVDEATGRVTSSANPQDFNRLAEKIVRDVKRKRINTRVLNAPSEDAFKDYLSELTQVQIGSGKSTNVEDMVVATIPAAQGKKPVTLNVADLHPNPSFPAIGAILDELSSIRYREFPNATFDLIRTFLEKSIKAYAAQKGEEIPRKGQYVFLDSALAWLREEVKSADKKSLVQVIDRLRQNDRLNVYVYGLTADYLNAANHNHEIFIDREDVTKLWDSIISLLRYVLRNPTT